MRSIIDNDVRTPLPAKGFKELRVRLGANFHLAPAVRVLPAFGLYIDAGDLGAFELA